MSKGLTPPRIASAVSAGIIVGIFPIYGPISLGCVGLALLLRLNLPLVLAGYYSMVLIKPLLILPFLRVGESIFHAEPMSVSLTELTRRFGTDALGTLSEFGWSFIHAAAGWMIATPVLFLLMYPVTLILARRWQMVLVRKEIS